MSRPISSFPDHRQQDVVRRRLAEKSGGLGYLAALDAQRILENAARARRARAELPDADLERAA